MWPYWLFYLIPAFAALAQPRVSLSDWRMRTSRRWNGGWVFALIALVLLVGYRFQVGGDWSNYLRNLEQMRYVELDAVFTKSDPGYRLLEWLSLHFDWGIYGVNVIGAMFFALGLVLFCRSLPRPWLALAVAMPYLVTVVGMGYTRQGIALGIGLMALTALGKRSILLFVLLVLLAATFHKSAVLLLPIAALAATEKRIWTAIWVGAFTLLGYVAFLEESVEHLYRGYIEAEYQSQGAQIRLLMNAVPAAILLLWRNHFQMSLQQMQLWKWFAFISLGLLAAFYVTPYSTAIDRIALYMIPLQLAVFSYVPEVFGRSRERNTPFVMAVLLYYTAVLFVWLNFATHARYWIPYQFYPFVDPYALPPGAMW